LLRAHQKPTFGNTNQLRLDEDFVAESIWDEEVTKITTRSFRTRVYQRVTRILSLQSRVLYDDPARGIVPTDRISA